MTSDGPGSEPSMQKSTDRACRYISPIMASCLLRSAMLACHRDAVSPHPQCRQVFLDALQCAREIPSDGQRQSIAGDFESGCWIARDVGYCYIRLRVETTNSQCKIQDKQLKRWNKPSATHSGCITTRTEYEEFKHWVRFLVTGILTTQISPPIYLV